MPANLSSSTLDSPSACTYKSTSPIIVTGKPRSLSDPLASPVHAVPPLLSETLESDMETTIHLERKSVGTLLKRIKRGWSSEWKKISQKGFGEEIHSILAENSWGMVKGHTQQQPAHL